MRVLALPGGGRAAVSHHALERYAERVRPHLEGHRDLLYADLQRLVAACGTVSPDRPAWINDDWTTETDETRTLLWLDCGDIAVPLCGTTGGERLLATTLLTRGGISDVARRRRNQRRSSRTWGARKGNRHEPGRRPDVGAPDA
jgi:hypothetical protein